MHQSKMRLWTRVGVVLAQTGGEIDLQSWEAPYKRDLGRFSCFVYGAPDQFDKLLTETAGNFLDVFVRQHPGQKQAQKRHSVRLF